MATRLSKGYSLQTGVWDKPQVISFDSLFERYSTAAVFGEESHEKITSVVNSWKELASDFMSSLKTGSSPVSPFAACLKTDLRCRINYSSSNRTAHVLHEQSPQIQYKIYALPTQLCHPMANTLRAPMSDLIAHTILTENLSEVGVVEEALFPLISKKEIATLDERKINEAFITCSKTIPIFSMKKTIQKVKEMPEESQRRLAHQCCTIPLKTGIGDFDWNNLNMHRENGKVYLLDTEPLLGELFINRFGKGFKECKDMLHNLSTCAQNGLEAFERSSQIQGLEIFENTAQTFLEKIEL